MNTTCGKALLRIKSPQLYRLSYQPKVTYPLENLVPAGALDVGTVPAVCPGLIATRSYHGTGR